MGQPDSSLCAATGQNLAAVPCPHALHKAMLFAALALFRLIGTKHYYTPQSDCRKALAGNLLFTVTHFVLYNLWLASVNLFLLSDKVFKGFCYIL